MSETTRQFIISYVISIILGTAAVSLMIGCPFFKTLLVVTLFMLCLRSVIMWITGQ